MYHMKIEGTNFFNYDAQHLQIIKRDTAESIKPNLFKDLDEETTRQLLEHDAVNLSPEAKTLLKKLRAQMAGQAGLAEADREESFQDLIYTLKQLRELVYKEQDQQQQELEDEQGAKPKYENPGQNVLPLSGRPRQQGGGGRRSLNGPVADKVGKMTVHMPSPEALEQLKSELVLLGEKMIDTVAGFGVRIILLPPDVPLTGLRIANMSVVAPGEKTFDGRDWAGVRGLYDQSRRLIVIGQEKLGHPTHSAARHEFAHAFDHTFSVRNKRRQALSVQLWNLFAEQRKGLVTPYAGTNPAEYFAESVETFFKQGGRETVLEKDPQMYQYLEALFAS
jgi:hypothetical protein